MLRTLFASMSLSLLAAACGPSPLPAAPTGKLKIVATFSVLADLARNVGGDEIEVVALVGPGQDTHTFEPSPAEAKTLAEAELIFENGLGFEPWLDDLYDASGATARRVVVTEGIEPLKAEEGHEEEGAEGEAHEHGEFDPHVWHSAANAIQMMKNIREALAQADPANTAIYQANAEAYLAQLQELDTWVFAQVKTLPEARRKLVTPHDTFGYFAERYGFEVIGTVLPTTTEGASPSAQELAALVETIRAQNVPAIFAENVSSNTLLNQVASEAGVKFIASLYTDALGPPGSDGDTYLKMMRFNVTTVIVALSQ